MIKKLSYILMLFIVISCDCGINVEKVEKDIVFKESELYHFSSFTVGDTIIYKDQFNNSDSIIIREITEHEENPKVDCSIFFNKASINSKSVSIEYLPLNIYPFAHWEVDSTAELKDFDWHLSMSLRGDPRELSFSISFKNFYFNEYNYQDFRIEKDTIIGDFTVSSYYLFPHSYPERIKDSSYITEVYWTAKHGLIAYKNKKGNIFSKPYNERY